MFHTLIHSTIMTNKNSLLANVVATETIFVNAAKIKRNVLGMSVIAESSIGVRAPVHTAKEFKERFGYDFADIHKVSFVKNARAYNYKRNVDKKLSDGKEIQTESLKGFEWLSEWENVVKVANKSGKKYLSCTYTDDDKSSVDTRYIVHGRFVTDDEKQFIFEHLKTKSVSQKQTALGIAENDQVKFGAYEFGKIYSIGSNDNVEPIWDAFIS